MCGITAYWSSGDTLQTRSETVQRMVAALHHRGPDANNTWVDATSGVALGQSRLAIQDLSEAGAQPMPSPGGRFMAVFNGEIYNHLELRDRLTAPPVWRGHSDTETLLACFEAWGIETTLQRAIGMFALAIWDRERHRLVLARDRFGEKPLYYGCVGGRLMVASELKSIHVVGKGQLRIDAAAAASFFQFAYVPAPRSIYEGIHKLPPGGLLEIGCDDLTSAVLPAPTSFWSAEDAARTARAGRGTVQTDQEAIEGLEQVLRQAVRRQLISDVPLGAFLSGGIDSSLIVALMQSMSSTPTKTFSIGFGEQEYNESALAQAVASHLGTDHTSLMVTAQDALATVPHLPEVYDEPFADASQIPTYLVARLARSRVTVSLSGDAGDELFAGYNRHISALTWDRWSRRTPYALRRAGAGALDAIPVSALQRLSSTLHRHLSPKRAPRMLTRHVRKAADALRAKSLDDLYERVVSHWHTPIVHGASSSMPMPLEQADIWGPAGLIMMRDTQLYLPDDILVKVDRACMASSLESRVPFLDPDVYAYAWSLPDSMKIRHGRGKWILRQLLYRMVPSALIDRPKMGFAVPIGEWLRGPLRDWAEDLLSQQALAQDGLLDPAPIRCAWRDHLTGQHNFETPLWTALMFQAWRRRWV